MWPDPFQLVPARVHEAEGQGRAGFALFQAVRHPGSLIWILPVRGGGLPMPWALPPGVPARILVVRPASEKDLLWAIEDSLRTSSVGLVIAEPEKPLSLTAGRRLQLAAEAGRSTGLMLIRENHGSNAAETRWHCDPVPAEGLDSTRHRWALIKNKSGTLREWIVDWDGASTAVHLVSEAGQ